MKALFCFLSLERHLSGRQRKETKQLRRMLHSSALCILWLPTVKHRNTNNAACDFNSVAQMNNAKSMTNGYALRCRPPTTQWPLIAWWWRKWK